MGGGLLWEGLQSKYTHSFRMRETIPGVDIL